MDFTYPLLIAFGIVVTGLFAANSKNDKKFDADDYEAIRQKYTDSPLNSQVQEATLLFLRTYPAANTEWFYSYALEVITENPDNVQAKTFALELGRWHYGRGRKDRLPTLYDEQAIQNDILVRSK